MGIMRICFVFQGSALWPCERIEKMAGSLSAAGHECFLLCNDDGGSTTADSLGTLRLVRLKPRLGSRRLNQLLKAPYFFNPLWVSQLRSTVKQYGIQALQVVDIPLAPTAVWVGRAFRIPVVLDMWENYPEALRMWGQSDWRTRIFKNYRGARVVERYSVRRVSHILTVVEEQKERLVAEGTPEQRISVVTNAVDERMFLDVPVRADTPLDAEPDCYKLLYVGKLTVERGLDDLIRGGALAARRIPSLRIHIAGHGDDEPRLRRLTEEQGISDKVRFAGFVPFRDIASYIRKSDLCAVPHVYSAFINTTVPNKLFQYMLLGKPVLVSNAKPLARITREARCGFVFESGNAADVADQIAAAYEARADAEIGERGRRQVLEHYTWNKVAPTLLRVYEELGDRAAGATANT
jgi:glycosyltransferase involved in cell wall biosynthesis